MSWVCRPAHPLTNLTDLLTTTDIRTRRISSIRDSKTLPLGNRQIKCRQTFLELMAMGTLCRNRGCQGKVSYQFYFLVNQGGPKAQHKVSSLVAHSTFHEIF